jgi:photosystem II stability/assembly factor-like uncharacterized protein
MLQPTTPRPRRAARTAIASGIVVLALPSAPAVAQEPPVEKPRLRQEYFYSQRAYPFDRIPRGALQRALAVYRTRWPQAGIARSPRTGASHDPSHWVALGPAPIATRDAGRISTIALHPTEPQTIYIGAAQGGVWRTMDGGEHWEPLTDGECSLAMGSLAVDPVAPAIIYAGTGELHFSGDSYYGCGVLRSADGGQTWTQLGATEFDTNSGGARISKVLIDRATAGSTTTTTVFVASNFGVYRSANSGASWTRVLEGIATDLVVDPAQPATLYAAIGSTAGGAANGIYRSNDRGISWTRLGGFPTIDAGRISLAIAESRPAVLYAAVQNAFQNPRQAGDGQLLGIWKTIDSGATWTKLPATNASCGSQCWYDLVLAVHPTNPDVVIFGGVNIYRSTDGGASFTNVLNNIHVDHHALAYDPRDPAIVYSGNDGGIFRSTSGGTSWLSVNGDLAITQFYSGIALHPSEAGVILGGTQDNGTLEFAGEPAWDQVLGADGGFTAIDFSNPNFAYAETQWTENSNFSGPRRRDFPGQGFGARKVLGIDVADRALFIPPLVMDPVDPAVLYFGTYRVYRTSNRADLWAAISGDLARTSNGRVSAIAAAESDRNLLYAGTNDGNLHVSEDGGANWDRRTGGLPDRAVTDIAVDATDARTAIMTVSGFGTGHVFRTSDAGRSWIDISANLPDAPVNAVVMSPCLGGLTYIGTDLGVFRSNGSGAWTPFNDGFPNVAVFDLAYSRTTGLLVAATHGRGMLAIPPVPAGEVTITRDSIAFTALGDTATLSATATGANGEPASGVCRSWRSLDPRVATVDANGVVRAAGNGRTGIIVMVSGAADTTIVNVRQVVVAITGLADTASLVTGEARQLTAAPVDRNGHAVADVPLMWSSTDVTVATVDAAGRLTAGTAGSALVIATAATFADSMSVLVAAPSVVALGVVPGDRTTVLSAAGTQVPLLRLQLSVQGIEAVRLLRLGFDAEGDDRNARIVLVRDGNGDGEIGADESEIGSAQVSLRPGEPAHATIGPSGLVISPGETQHVIVALRMSGATPHGTSFRASFIPAETRTVGVRSGAADRVSQPASPVASPEIESSVLADDAVFSLSENPVRSRTVILNFSARPTVAQVYTITGRLVVDLLDRMDGDARATWDLTNAAGSRIDPGVYLLVVELDGQQVREKLIILTRNEDAPQPAERFSRR